MAQDDQDHRAGIQVIARAAAILRALAEAPGLTLGEVARAVGLPRSTVQRIAGALAAERLVAAGGRGLRIGPGLAALAAAARPDVPALCRPVLEALSERTGETADLSAFRGDRMVFLDQVPGTHRLRTVSAVGEAFPLATTANGRACLALMPPDRALALAQAEWRGRGVPADPEALAAELDAARATGLAQDLDEHTLGISALGFAFADPGGELFAISVPVPSQRFPARRAPIEAALRDAARAVARALA